MYDMQEEPKIALLHNQTRFTRHRLYMDCQSGFFINELKVERAKGTGGTKDYHLS